MALRSLATKFWKPAAVGGATVYGAYGTYEWNRAKSSLHMQGMSKEKLGEVFDSIDVKKTGFIGVEDLATVLNKSGGKKFSVADVQAMLAVADEDHDGKLCKEEFVHVCESVTSPKEKSGMKLPDKNIAELTKVNENALEAKYGVAPHEHKHPLSASQLHDEVKSATELKKTAK